MTDAVFHFTEILILGVGDKVVQVHKSVWDFARANRIALEVMDTVSLTTIKQVLFVLLPYSI